MTPEQILHDLLVMYPGTKKIDNMVATVTEIVGSAPKRLFNVLVTGSMSGNPINFTYTTDKDSEKTKNNRKREQARYELLYDIAVVAEDVTEEVSNQIDGLGD